MSEQASPGEVAEQLRLAVGRFVRSVRSHSGTATTAQSEVLGQLEREGPASVASLAAARGVRHQSMRLLVARLAELGLVAFQADPHDRRSTLVSISAPGIAELERGRAARSAHLTALLATRLDAAELDLLRDAAVLLDRLSGEGDPAPPKGL